MPNRMIYVPSEILTGRTDTIVAVSPRFTDYTLISSNRALLTLRVTTPLPIIDIALYLYNGYYGNQETAMEWLRGLGFNTDISDNGRKPVYLGKDDGQAVPIIHLLRRDDADTGVRTIEYYRMMALRNLEGGPYSW